MNRRSNIIKALTLGLMIIVTFPCFSTPETGEPVTRRGTVNDDYYAAGGTVNNDADIAGDIVASAGDLFIGHRLQGDVMAAGGSVNMVLST
jgi:hypothetical protein